MNTSPNNRLNCAGTAEHAATMKRIGLLGGMSWESSALYYRLLNEGVADRLGGLHSADCVLVSVDFATIAGLQASDRWEEAGHVLAQKAGALQAAGAELLLLCTNTMHKVAEQIQNTVDIPLLNIIDVTAAAAQRAGACRVGLLATSFTMEQRFYRDRMASHGVDVIVPDASARELVHRVIYEELCRGIFRDASRAMVSGVIADLVDRGAEAVILGCTEIELLIGQSDSPVPVLPSTQLHAAAALDAALGSPREAGYVTPRKPLRLRRLRGAGGGRVGGERDQSAAGGDAELGVDVA